MTTGYNYLSNKDANRPPIYLQNNESYKRIEISPPKPSPTSCPVPLWPMSTEPIPCPAAAPPSPPRRPPNTWPHNTMTA